MAPTSWIRWTGLACILIPSAVQLTYLYLHIKWNATLYQRIQEHFTHPDLVLNTRGIGSHDMRVVIYIGESTTSLHWGLYGYPRKTTPELDAFAAGDPGLLVFRHVVSTHVHTSASLLEALSFATDAAGDYQSIDEKRRIPLTEVLERLSVPTFLLSNQGPAGTFSLASYAIFNRVSHSEYPPDAALLGNQAWRVAQHEDKYFQSALDRFRTFNPQAPAVLFLHSYAGHGNYLRNIPKWARNSVDDRLKNTSMRAVFGTRLTDEGLLASNAEGYDSAMHYVTLSITKVLEQVAAAPEPTVFLYFSDHGESPYTNTAHDSSRYQHEMSRIPFLMYFNQTARTTHSDLFETFQQASQHPQPSTLAQVPGTVLTLLGYETQGLGHDHQGIGLDAQDTLPPILVREIGENFQYVRSHGAARESRSVALDSTDAVTTLWLNSRARGDKSTAPLLCYDQANTWAKAVRGSAVADCLAVTLDLTDAGLDAAPALVDSPGWVLQAVADITRQRGLLLQLDASRLPAKQACEAMQGWLSRQSTAATGRMRLILTAPGSVAVIEQAAVKLASASELTLPAACQILQANGIALSLQVPESLLDDASCFVVWQKAIQAQGWPVHYTLPQSPTTDLWTALSRVPGASWALGNASVTDLPWGAGVPELESEQPSGRRAGQAHADEQLQLQPDSLTIMTNWDPNSR